MGTLNFGTCLGILKPFWTGKYSKLLNFVSKKCFLIKIILPFQREMYGGLKGSNTNQFTKTQNSLPKHKTVYQNTNQFTKTQNNFLKHKPIFQNTNQFTKTQINFTKHKPISRNTNQKTGQLLCHYQRAWKGLIPRIFRVQHGDF